VSEISEFCGNSLQQLPGIKCFRVDMDVSMLKSMPQSMQLDLIFCTGPIQFLSFQSLLVRDPQEDEDIRICETLPHIRYIGVFLGDVPAAVTLSG